MMSISASAKRLDETAVVWIPQILYQKMIHQQFTVAQIIRIVQQLNYSILQQFSPRLARMIPPFYQYRRQYAQQRINKDERDGDFNNRVYEKVH